MIYINIANLLIQSFLLSYTFLFSLDIKKRHHACLLTLVCFIEDILIYCLPYSNVFSYLCIFFTFCCYLFLFQKEKQMRQWIILIALLVITIVSDLFGQSIAYILDLIPEVNITGSSEVYYVIFINSKLILLINCLIFYVFVHQDKSGLNIKEWWSLFIFIIIVLMIFLNLLESLIYQTYTIYTIISLFIEFICLSLCSLFIYHKIRKQNQENIVFTKELIKIQHQKQMYELSKHMLNQMNADKHKMLYILMNIEHSLKENQFDDAQKKIQNEIKKFLNYKHISSTGYVLFDYEMTRAINYLLSQEIDIKVLYCLGENIPILEQNEMINYITKMLFKLSKINEKLTKLEIFFQEVNSLILLKMIIQTKNEQFILEPHFLDKNEHIFEVKPIYGSGYTELNILMKKD